MAIPTLHEVRLKAMDHALGVAFPEGRRPTAGTAGPGFADLRAQTEFALWAAYEYTDPSGPRARDRRLVDAGTDALRRKWSKPTEQIECSAEEGRASLHGRVHTKWEVAGKGSNAGTDLHNRELDVAMQYGSRELLLTFKTLHNKQRGDIPSRLLFLLSARPTDASPCVSLPEGDVMSFPPSNSSNTRFRQSTVGPIAFSAPDGSCIEIVPEDHQAECVTVEKPPAGGVPRPGRPEMIDPVKPANEGCVRVAFEGPHVLDHGRYRIRFLDRRT